MSGIIGALVSSRTRPPVFETSYLLGLLSAGSALLAVSPAAAVYGPHDGVGLHWAACAVGGVAVGYGARLGSGCTSGHGIVGLARLSPRSLAAVLIFFGTAILTAGFSRARFLRGTLYSAGSLLPPPTSSLSWSLSPGLYIVPLVVSVAVIVLLRVTVAYLLPVGPSANQVVLELLPVGDSVTTDEYEYLPVPEPPSPTEPPAEAITSTPKAVVLVPPGFASLVGAGVAVWICGACFGLSLGLSGMLDPVKVLRFLDFTGDAGWDPQLALVMGCGVLTNLVLVRAMAVGALSQAVPPFAAALGGSELLSLGKIINYGPSCPANRVVNGALIAGSVLFGFGWGLTGVCPGPAVVDYVTGGSQFGVTVPAMFFGMSLHGFAGFIKCH